MKNDEEKVEDVTEWRKRKIFKAKNGLWENFLRKLDYSRDGPKPHRLLNVLNGSKQ